jgi:hypothetical protein
MGLRRWFTVFGVVGLVMCATGTGAGAAASLAVTPSTNLVDGQLVSLSIAGFPANTQIGVLECVLGAVDENGCDLNTLQYVTTDANGHVSTPFIVTAALSTANGHVDCRATSCSIGAGTFDQSTTAGHALSFNPTAPLAPALHLGLTVNTNGGVNNHTNVATIDGTLMCNRAAIVELYGQLTQLIPFHGVSLVSSATFDEPQVLCGAPTDVVTWKAVIPASTSVFPGGSLLLGYKVGNSTADINAFGHGGNSTASATVTNASIRLRSAH